MGYVENMDIIVNTLIHMVLINIIIMKSVVWWDIVCRVIRQDVAIRNVAIGVTAYLNILL